MTALCVFRRCQAEGSGSEGNAQRTCVEKADVV
jgi:hypothetical protein